MKKKAGEMAKELRLDVLAEQVKEQAVPIVAQAKKMMEGLFSFFEENTEMIVRELQKGKEEHGEAMAAANSFCNDVGPKPGWSDASKAPTSSLNTLSPPAPPRRRDRRQMTGAEAFPADPREYDRERVRCVAQTNYA